MATAVYPIDCGGYFAARGALGIHAVADVSEINRHRAVGATSGGKRRARNCAAYRKPGFAVGGRISAEGENDIKVARNCRDLLGKRGRTIGKAGSFSSDETGDPKANSVLHAAPLRVIVYVPVNGVAYAAALISKATPPTATPNVLPR